MANQRFGVKRRRRRGQSSLSLFVTHKARGLGQDPGAGPMPLFVHCIRNPLSPRSLPSCSGVPGSCPLGHRAQQRGDVGGTGPRHLLVGVRQLDLRGHAAQHRVVQVARAVGAADDERAVVRGVARDAVPVPQEDGLGVGVRHVAVAPPRAQQRVHLVDEDDGGLQFLRQREDGADQLLALAHPLAEEGLHLRDTVRGGGAVWMGC